jgi:preprotein translocase subunit SecB
MNEPWAGMLRAARVPATRRAKAPRRSITLLRKTIIMADEPSIPDFIDPAAGNGNDGLPQVGILAQYVKDLSFENPNAPAVYQWQGQPQMDVQVNIGVSGVGQDLHEVVLKIEVEAKSEEGIAFRCETLYAGLFALRNIPDEQLQPFLLAEAPRLLFPFARQVVSGAVTDGGFPPLLLDPIDFGGLYMQSAAQQQAEALGGQAGDPGQA